MAKIRRRRGRAMESCPIQKLATSHGSDADEEEMHLFVIKKRKIENMKALMMQLACSDPSRLSYDDLIEEKIQMLMMRSLPDHPTYAAMIIGALQQLKEEEGSTEEAISSYISERYDDLPLAHATFLKHHLKQLVQKEEIFRISGNRYMLIGSIARTELKESQEPKSKPQVEQIEGQKQDFNAKGSAEVNKESQGEEQTNYAIDKQIEEQPGSTEECNKELRENTEKIMGQTDAGNRMADESNDMSQHNNGAIRQQSQGLENPTEVITMEQTDAGDRMADELKNDKGQHNNSVIRKQSRGLQNRKEVIAATQEQSGPTCEATEILPPGEEIMQASDEQHHPEQQNDDIGYRNQLQDLKRLQEQQNDFYAKIIELYTIVENLKKSKEVDGPRTISSSSALTDLGVNQSCSLLFSTEEGLQLLWKVTGINHQLAEILNSSSLPKASSLASESVVGGQQRDLSANHSLLTTAPCQGPECNNICSRKSQDKHNQKRSYCRRSSMEYGMKTVTPENVYTSQCQEKSPSQVSHSKKHLDSKKTVNSFKRRKKIEFNAELLVETSVGRSDQVKVDQLGGNALVPSTTGRPQTEEHLKNTETTERVTTRMQKKRSGVFKEPASTLVSEQLHQQREERKVSVPYSRRKRRPDSAVEDSLFLKDFFALKKRAKKDTKMKMKQLDREQQEEHEMIKMPQEQGILVEDAVMFPDTVNETPEHRKSATEIFEKQQQAGEADPQACSELLGEKSFEEGRKRKQMKGLQQQRLLRSRAKRPSDSGVVEELASAEVQDEEHLENTESKDTTQSAGVSSPENLDEQNFQLGTNNTMPDKDDEEAGGSLPTKPKRRGRPPGSLKGLKLKKKMQLQRPKNRRGRPCKEKMEIKTAGTRGRPCKTKVATDTSTNELSSKQAEESEPQGKESVTDIDKGISEQENPEEAAGETNADHLQGRDMITSSSGQQQRLQTLKSSQGRITRSKLAGP